MKKRALIWILTITIVLSSLPVCASAADYSDAYAAYLGILKSNQTKITQYQKWEESWRTDHKCGVVLCDICGDNTPELMYCTVEQYYSRLYIYTFEKGGAKLIYNNILESEVAGGTRCCLFQTAGDKSLYLYHSFGDESWEYKFTRYTYSGGKLVPDTEYVHNRQVNYPSYKQTHTYTCNGSTISASTYTEKTNKMLNSMSTVLFSISMEYENEALYNRSLSADHIAMTLQQAMAFLSGTKKLPFVDTDDTAYYADPVAWAVDKGITNGLNATCFGPNRPCTRGQVVTFLWRANGSPAPKSKNNPFTDVKSGQYYYNAVLWAVEQGITTGITPTSFGPDSPCTRGQVVTFLWRAKGSKTVSGSSPFTDVRLSQYYGRAVLWAVNQKITTGKTANTFAPEEVCTRAQIVTFLYRTYD